MEDANLSLTTLQLLQLLEKETKFCPITTTSLAPFHYCPVSSWQVFRNKSLSSFKVFGTAPYNLLAFSPCDCQKPPATTCRLVREYTFIPCDQWLLRNCRPALCGLFRVELWLVSIMWCFSNHGSLYCKSNLHCRRLC